LILARTIALVLVGRQIQCLAEKCAILDLCELCQHLPVVNVAAFARLFDPSLELRPGTYATSLYDLQSQEQKDLGLGTSLAHLSVKQ